MTRTRDIYPQDEPIKKELLLVFERYNQISHSAFGSVNTVSYKQDNTLLIKMQKGSQIVWLPSV